jgi:hypothetical protein
MQGRTGTPTWIRLDMLNPINDDLGSRWASGRPEPKSSRDEGTGRKAWDGPVESLAEKEENLNRIEALYGRQDKPVRYREGRPVREPQG